MKAQLLKEYMKCRKEKPFMLYGEDAKCSLSAAKTILRFKELESEDMVKIEAEPEEESYFDAYGEPESEKEKQAIIEALDSKGCWWVCAYWWNKETREWEQADSIGMCVYDNPCSPYENCYVVGLMKSAIDAYEAQDEIETIHAIA